MNSAEQLILEEKLKKYFRQMIVLKTPKKTKLFSVMNIPTFMRDWIVMRFSDTNGEIDEKQVIDYVRRTIPDKEQWSNYLVDMLNGGQKIKILTRIRIDFDIKNSKALFSLPNFNFPSHKGDAVVEWSVLEKNRQYLLSTTEVWGIVEIACEKDSEKNSNVFKLKNFKPFCPYTIDLDYFVNMRKYFTTEEWIDIIISAIDYNPDGYQDMDEKLHLIRRLLPFAEKRLNLIELAPKETGKSYIFSQISQFGWLVSGGSMSRARLFYDISKKTNGLVSRYDFVALDEIQTIDFTNPEEMAGGMKSYMESGEYHVGDYRGTGESGIVLLGNIPSEVMDINKNMLVDLPKLFCDSALLDRFHGFIEGWKIPKMKENMKAEGWALNSEYFSEVIHLLRDEPAYRAVVDDILEIPKDAAARDTEAVKRICTAFLKLLFPHVRKSEDVDPDEFSRYCLAPALEMRSIIKRQMEIQDPGEFFGKKVPNITLKQEIRYERICNK